VEPFPLTFEGYTYAHGHIAYVEGRPPAPVIQVQHNYAGLKQFDIDQACFLARCGYVGLAVDLYREYDIIGADDPALTYAFVDRDPKRDLNGYGQNIKGQVSDAQKARALRHGAGSTGCMYGLLRNPKHYRGLMGAWLDHARTHPAVHPEYAGSIGYCLGGQSLLEQVRDGQNVQAVVSFHGLLHSRPPPFPGEQSANAELAASRGGFFERMTKEEFESHPKIDNAPNNHNTGCKVLIENGTVVSLFVCAASFHGNA
jgi:dienelactone hydrolase